MSSKPVEVIVEGRQLKLSNLDKILYPQAGFTKGQVIDYYTRIAPAVLPHLKDRTLTLKRYPNGVEDEYFYEKQSPKHRPDWVLTQAVWAHGNGRNVDFTLCNDLPTLVWLANLADLELHTNLSLARDVFAPTMVVFDLDPGPPATIVECCRVGLRIREILDQLKIKVFAKTSGSKGLQLYIPLNTPATYDETKPFAHAIAELLEKQHPNLVLSKMSKVAREGKVFVDWSQNDRIKTTVNVYSLRAKDFPTVSTPVTWEEVAECLDRGEPDLLRFTSDQALARYLELGDLFAPVLKLKQRLPVLAGVELKPGRPRKPGASRSSGSWGRKPPA
ncbi:MAG: non-homologous end-joining DNA ligase [Candidatus Dormibacteraeota bacterium]|nr:non-homologous end-joining DNA ligase [Candidatus Dormibacteraeota bacterium]